MNIDQLSAGNRRQFCFGLLGLVALASGCGDSPTPPPLPPPGAKTPGEAEAEARKNSGNPKTTKGSPKL